MPILNPWYVYTGFEIVARVPVKAIGVYEIADEQKTTIYIGRGEIRSRLDDHGNKSRKEDYIPGATWFRFVETPYPVTLEEALLLEFKKANGRLPRYNN